MRRPLPLIVTVVLVVIIVLAIAGCSNNNEPSRTPTPAPVTPSVEISEGSTPTPGWITPNGSEAPTAEPTRDVDPEPTRNNEPDPKPTAAPSSSDAGTPATQFAARWGQRYPNVPEYLILKAANSTCRLIETTGQGWEDSPLFKPAVENIAEVAGISSNDAFEFAQDADQNYCSSVSNPT